MKTPILGVFFVTCSKIYLSWYVLNKFVMIYFSDYESKLFTASVNASVYR
ncbi:hypothetical protein L1275_002617 [Flavobacterium sp. HSC-61S13]|nr:hypothetical protein [Flavobacterium sp. HSC-61S13]